MRLILFFVFLISLGGWAAYKFTSKDDASVLNFAAGKGSKTAIQSAERVASHASSGSSTSKKVSLPPIVSSSYIFKHRPLPNNEFFQSLTSSSASSNDQRSAVRLSSDAASRTAVVIGHADEVSRILGALKLSDVPSNSCHAKAWVVFVRSDKNDSFDFGLELASSPSVSSFSLNSKTFSGVLGIRSVEAKLDILRNRGLVEVVQAPHLSMSSGQVSLIETGEEIAVPVVTVNQSVTQTTVEYRKVGLSLELTPHFLAEGRIRLGVKQSNGLVGQLRDVGGFEVPELTNQTLRNTIETKIGQVVVLGGVQSSQYQKVKGLLSYKRERQSGFLYVVLATYSTIPVAQPVLESVPSGSSLLPPKLKKIEK